MIDYKIQPDPVDDNDVLKLEQLYQFEILDSASEADFDAIALLASEIFETEHAYISFANENTVFLKSDIAGFGAKHATESMSTSALNLFKDGAIAYDDTDKYHELLDNSFLAGSQDIRFFAAAPIVTPEGFMLGTIAVADGQPRSPVSGRQLKTLQLLADMVMSALEKRIAIRKIAMAYDSKLHRLVHDMKNPITSISLYAQLLSNREMSADKVSSMGAKIEKSTKVIEQNLNKLLLQN